MSLTSKDRIALFLGTAFGYLSILAGYAGLSIAFLYGFLVIPVVVIFAADQKRILIWQSCILAFALCIIVANSRLGSFKETEALTVFFTFWAGGTVISSPAIGWLFWRSSKNRREYRVEWLFIGLAFVGLVGFLSNDPFVFVGLMLLWLVLCSLKFAWDWHGTVDTKAPSKATVVATSLLVVTILASTLSAAFFKQRAFRMAIDRHYFAIARVLVTAGADPNGTDRFGQAALVDAAWNATGDPEGVKVLLSMGADVNMEQSGGLSGMVPSGTALHVAAAAGRTQICESLLKAGADVDKKNQTNSTPLLVALSRGTINCAPILLAYRADVNATDTQGRTPMMLLMAFGPDETVTQNVFHELVAKGADLNTKDNAGKTAEDWALSYKHGTLAEQLRVLRDSQNPHP